MMKQKLALLLTALLLLTGCSSGGSGDTADGQDDGELETIDVVLDWYPNAVHAFLYEAEEKGYFAEEGLQVNILFPSNASDPLTMTAAGRADIGFYYQEDTIIARANEDVPVKVLGAVVQQPISIVCALAEKNIKTPEDLIGKTIGYSGTRFGEVAVGQMLETVGATLDDVELIDVGFDLMSAMTTGNVDATFGCFINHEVPALEEEGFAVDYMEVMDYGVPNYYALMLVTGEDQLEANRDKYTRFLRACQKGFADMQADPEEALGLLLANQDEENFPLTESVERRSFDVLLPIMETADAPFLSQDVSVWQENIDWLQKVGMIDAAFDPAEVMVDLLAEYEKVGLQLDCRELPDYLPLYLEYLSVLPDDQAKEGLLNVAPILALLGGRLKQREAPWYALFDALLQLAGSSLSSDSVTKQVNSEERDDTRQALDAVWEEEQVKFIEDNATACDSSPLNQYQRRFSQDVAPQYVDISAGGGK